MLAAMLCSVVLAADPASRTPTADELRKFHEAEVKAGRDAEAHVKLALWCEARGMTAERIKHLALAILADPSNATARGLMGFVRDGGTWRRPEDVAERVRSDEAQSAILAEYDSLRDKAAPTADAQWKLSTWCDKNGLAPQAEAHARAVLRIDPSRKGARERLGYKLVKGRWVTDADLATERREADAQKRADRQWGAKLAALKGDLRDPKKKAATEVSLSTINDPRAVPSVVRVFSTRDPGDQRIFVQLLGQIDGGNAARLLAAAALFADSPEARRLASETLVRRDPRDFVSVVIAQFREPLKYQVKPVGGPGSPGVLMVEGKEYIVRRHYSAPTLPEMTQNLVIQRENGFVPTTVTNPRSGIMSTVLRGGGMFVDPAIESSISPFSPIGQAIQRRDQIIARDTEEAQKAAISSQVQLEQDVAQIERDNAFARELNGRAQDILIRTTGKDLGQDRTAWSRWWTDVQGYAFVAPPSRATKPVFDQTVPPGYQPQFSVTSTACFVAGTPVRTREGLKPIEKLQVGDLVLAQDVKDGRLGFEPIVAVFHNPPSPTFELKLDDDAIVATGIHRFWSVGKGWTMVRDLKPGDLVRTVGGSRRVKAIEPKAVELVYNLEVARSRSFFVGKEGALVHDNSTVEAIAEPFDAVKP